MTATNLAPRIYVACLASYNNGVLHGEWINANQDADSIREEIAKILRTSKYPNVEVTCPDCADSTDPTCATCNSTGKVPSAEEYAIHDYEDFGGVTIGEYEPIDRVSEIAEMLAKHGEAFAKYADYVGIDYATEEDFEEAYAGEWDSEEAYTESTIEEGLWGEIPEHLANYIDTAKMARDLFIGDYFSAESSNHTIYVFRRT